MKGLSLNPQREKTSKQETLKERNRRNIPEGELTGLADSTNGVYSRKRNKRLPILGPRNC